MVPFDQDIEWMVCGIVFKLCDSYFYHVNVTFLSEKAELIISNYCAARICALGR